MTDDLTATRDAVLAARLRPEDALARSLQAADTPALTHTYIRRFDEQARVAARIAGLQIDAGLPLPPLAGLSVSVKDLFDVQGAPTSAASRILSTSKAAKADSEAVARLRRAGAAIAGHTNMTEFAFSGIGLNPNCGTPANVAADRLGFPGRIPGGSTSGGASSVAGGAAWAALGSDTGGSIRIPAALQGLVGFKNTARLTPLRGAIPLSTTLDTACAISLSVRDAVLLHEVLAAREVPLVRAPLAHRRLAVPIELLDGLDLPVSNAFERALDLLSQAGARIEEIPLPEFAELASINASGGFSATESWARHRHLLAERGAEIDPRVVTRIRRGEGVSAADYLDLVQARAAWIERMLLRIQGFDAMLSPTVPIVAPTIESLSSDEAFFATNALLLRNPSVVNMLDGCALSLPCQQAGELPVGLMVWAGALRDDTVLDVSLAIEHALQQGGF